jgi:hypothetical protein
MQRRVKRTRFNLKQTFGGLLNVLRNGVAVARAGQQRSENQQI